MKKVFLSLIAILCASIAAAQNPTAYFMEGSIVRMQLNPAFAPLRDYVNIPVLGGIQVGTTGNLALDNLFFPRNGRLVTVLDSAVSASDALAGLDERNLLGLDTRINVIGFGSFTKNGKNFWSFDLNVRVNEDTTLPYSLFDFMKNGTEGAIRNIGIATDAYAEAAFSYSFPLLNDRLYVGVRGKFLAGFASARMQYDRFDVTLRGDRWAVDSEGSLDLFAAEADYTVDPETGKFEPGDIDLKPVKPVGYGFAVDLGATYDVLPDLQVSLAVNDLGFISWGKGNAIAGRSAEQLEFTGTTVPDDGTTAPDFALDLLKFEPTAAGSATRMLRASINAGVEYEVWRHKIGLGLLYTARILEYKTRHNLTASVNFHPVRWFGLTGSYSVLDNRCGAVGLGLNLCPNWINFFLATDILTTRHTPQWLPIRQSTMNVTLGIGIPMGRRSYRPSACAYDTPRR